ncbi:MobF family relaxase [Compostimonas suwonensis]|uniref:TrwC relaxase n=1 Tax=Compostimonas suwonensis TaxID=1048394 RepID=A0A2M9BBR2_9MICO|nr:MobF family relaxase [Compostimonas suwonensis]PJJ55383.1 TrwC relaxase [Compostimonas suwonensis]
MKGGVIPFRGTGAAALRYLESDRSRADDYYLEGGTAIAEFAVVDGTGAVIGEGALNPEEYSAWVDWINPLTGESMGKPRQAGEGRRGSPRFLEMVVNAPKSLSIAAALHPEVSAALDVAQQDAVAEIRRWLGEHSVTRIGPRGRQEVVPVQQLETVSIVHHTSRAGDPHRHIHFQIGARVWAAGKWRGLDTGALFRQQGAIRALGTAVIAAHPHLAQVLDAHGLTLDPMTGEVAELEPYNAVMSKRSAQVQRNLARFRAEWDATHPGQEPGPVVRGRLEAMAWDHERPAKKPATLKDEAAWRAELDAAGYTPDLPRVRRRAPVALDDLSVQQVASRALDRCAAAASTWTAHDVQEHVTRIITEAGARATPEALRDLVAITTRLAIEDCLSVLPPDSVQPEHVAHLTTLHVVAVETNLRDRLTARATGGARRVPDVTRLARAADLDPEQAPAAAAVAGTDPLVVVEGAAGAGKTTMLGAAIEAATGQGRRTRVVTPTKKAADVAAQELGVPTDSAAKLVHEHGWRWNQDGVWTRLAVGDTDPETGATYTGPSDAARLTRGERIVVDEAGMLDQDTALALLTVADEHGATLALVGDRAQLPAVGRGGVLDMAAQLAGRVYDMTTVHRFADPEYADLTVQLRRGEHPALLFDRLHALGLVVLHEDSATVQEAIARDARDGDAITTATNDEARELNERIRDERVRAGLVDDARTTTGSDGLSIGRGDVIQTRQNDSDVQVANRQTWTVQAVGQDGTVWAKENATGRRRQRTVRLPAEYVAEHSHLAYASTAYGVQGATVPASHTILSDALDASGVYVGMTRGQQTNRLHVVAGDVDDAREQFVGALERDRADRGLVAATQAAREAVAGLAVDGPVRLVNAERARLTEQIERAERQAEKWERVLTALDRQRQAHRAEADNQEEVVAAADARAAVVRAGVAAPLIEQAAADGLAYLAGRDRMWEAQATRASAGRLRKRAASRAAAEAAGEHRATEDAVRRRWGGLPPGAGGVESWAETVAGKQADADPHVTETRNEAQQTHREQGRMVERHLHESIAMSQRALGGSTPSRVIAHAAKLRKQAERDRHDLARIEALPVTEAAQYVRELTARAEAEREAAERARAAREARAAQLEQFPPSPGHDRTGPERGGLGM